MAIGKTATTGNQSPSENACKQNHKLIKQMARGMEAFLLSSVEELGGGGGASATTMGRTTAPTMGRYRFKKVWIRETRNRLDYAKTIAPEQNLHFDKLSLTKQPEKATENGKEPNNLCNNKETSVKVKKHLTPKKQAQIRP